MTRLFSNRHLALLIIIAVFVGSFTPTVTAQNLDPEQTFMSAQGYELKNKHLVTYITFLTQTGALTANPGQRDIEQNINDLARQFMTNPAQTLYALNSYEQAVALQNYAPQAANYSSDFTSSFSTDVFNIEAKYASVFPNEQADFNSPRVRQAKQFLSGTMLKHQNHNYYPGDIGGSATFSEQLELCSNGQFTWRSNSHAGISGADLGGHSQSGEIITGYWTIVSYQNQLGILFYTEEPMVQNSAGKGFFAMSIGTIAQSHTSLIFNGQKTIYRMYAGQAQCR